MDCGIEFDIHHFQELEYSRLLGIVDERLLYSYIAIHCSFDSLPIRHSYKRIERNPPSSSIVVYIVVVVTCWRKIFIIELLSYDDGLLKLFPFGTLRRFVSMQIVLGTRKFRERRRPAVDGWWTCTIYTFIWYRHSSCACVHCVCVLNAQFRRQWMQIEDLHVGNVKRLGYWLLFARLFICARHGEKL